MLSSLERRSARWESDPESARSALVAAVSLVLRFVGRESDPAKSKEHVLLSELAERRLRDGGAAENPPGPGHTDYFDELLERIRDIRASERRFYQKVMVRNRDRRRSIPRHALGANAATLDETSFEPT